MDISEETTPNSGSSADETAAVSPQGDFNNGYKINDDVNDKIVSFEIMNIEKIDNFANKSKQFMNNILNPASTTKTTTTTMDMIKPKYLANIARTETNSHPLMLSPNGTDSETDETEVAGHIPNDNGDCQNFPDVIPRDESSNILAYNNISDIISPNNITALNKSNNSPDLLSSESEADLSPYHTAVESNFQTVALIPNNNNHINLNHNIHNTKNKHNNNHYNNNKLNLITNRSHQQQPPPQLQHQLQSQKQRIILTGCEDISSLDSISNHSFDNEPNLASLSPSSSLMDIDALNDNENHANNIDDDDDDEEDDDENIDDDDDDHDIINIMHMGLPKTLIDKQDDADEGTIILLSSSSPSNDKRRRQRRRGSNNNTIKTTTIADVATTTTTITTGITHNLSDNSKLPQYSASEEQRDVRNWQKIILTNGTTHEIDMRVIEPYKRVLSHGGYLKAGGHNAIVLFCACHLPDRSRTDYSYVMDNLFLYVVKTLDQLVTEDYVLVYLHGGSDRRSIPPFPWLKRCYQLLDRRLRKSLKNMYLVHPTFWLKSIVWMARPFVSTKFWRKLIYVKSLEELRAHVAIEKAAIPEKVKQYDAKYY